MPVLADENEGVGLNDPKNPYSDPENPLVAEVDKKSRVANFLVIVATIGILVAVFLPTRRRSRHAARRMQCSNNLKQIGLALHNYQSVFGTFPPAFTKAADETPMHSWRVLLLPYLEQQALYDQIDLNQPWDAPVHQVLHASCPSVYRCPEAPLPEGHTTYQAILDSEAWGQKHEASTHGGDDRMNVRENALVLETTKSQSILWMNPNDREWLEHQRTLSTKIKDQVHAGFVTHVVLVDGTVHSVADDELDGIGEHATE